MKNRHFVIFPNQQSTGSCRPRSGRLASLTSEETGPPDGENIPSGSLHPIFTVRVGASQPTL